ncbi:MULTISPECIES: MFS transporter [unclassified Inquilinus]|uniref:MFS transporter n=1 Tax=unclassified Inquilinus TaxID=2645927 RepID=UPI003F9219E5
MRAILLVPALSVCLVGAVEFMLAPMLAPLADAFAATPEAAARLVSAYALAYAAAAPFAGRLADRIGRRRVLLPALLLSALDGVALTLAPTLEVAIGLRLIGGLASAALIPGAFALVADLVPAERQTAAMGRVALGMTAGIAAGPALAGILTEAWGWRAPFLATAAVALGLFAVARAVLPADAPAWNRPPAPPLRRLLRAALLRPLLAKAGWLGAAVAALLLSGEVLRARHGFGPAAAGGATALFALGLALGNLAAGWVDRALGGPEAALLAALALLMAAVGGFLLWPGPPAVALACLGLWGVALGIAAPASGSLLVRRAGAAVGTVLALGESLNNVALMLLMPLAAALLAEGGAAAAAPLLLGLQAIGMAAMALDRRWLRGVTSTAVPHRP